MSSVAVLDDYLKLALSSADWSTLPAQTSLKVFHEHLGDEDAVAEALAEFDVIAAMRERTPFPASLIARLPRLKLLVTTGMRNLSIDMDAARQAGVTVCGTPMLGYPAFEHTWGLIMALTKNICAEDALMKRGGWQRAPTVGLKDKTLGLMGLGKLGAQSAQVGRAFGMRVIAWSQNLTPERASECGAEKVDKQTLLGDSDVLSVHLVLSERTRSLIGPKELAAMKPTAFLVNTSRGPIVDEQALIDALRGRQIAGAGIDVFDVEPLPSDHPLRQLDNVVLSGHTGYSTVEAFALMYPQTLQCICAWFDGEPVRVLN